MLVYSNLQKKWVKSYRLEGPAGMFSDAKIIQDLVDRVDRMFWTPCSVQPEIFADTFKDMYYRTAKKINAFFPFTLY